MRTSMAHTRTVALPVKAENRAKADLRKAEVACPYRVRVGQAVERARLLRGWNNDELADKVGRDERQVARWQTGDERPQFDVLFSVNDDLFRNALVIAFAELGTGVTINTVINVRMERTA